MKKKRKVCFIPPKLVTESKKQPQTQKPEILQTSTFNSDQITQLDHFKVVFYGGFAYVVT